MTLQIEHAPTRTDHLAGVAIITLQNEPVNTLDRPTRRALLAALESVEQDPSVQAVIITGDAVFSAGADIEEFDRGEALAEPSLHLTIAGFLDVMSKPVVAAIRKAALGGGLELALACHFRVATPDAKLGLPETTLGFMPGAGGTQRLPRAVGLDEAVNMILSGRPVTGTKALELGLVDAVADDPVAHALELVSSPPAALPVRLRDREVDSEYAEGFLAFVRQSLAKEKPVSPGKLRAVDALAAALTLPFDDALAVEYGLFTELLGTDQARAARYRFVSERAAGREALRDGVARPFATAGVVGAGTMGRGIALALASAGLEVTITDANEQSVEAALDWVAGELTRQVSRGRLRQDAADRTRAAIVGASQLTALDRADLIVEAVFERLDVKQDVFRQLDAIAKPDAVLATNTSTLDVDLIAAATARPQQVLGIHFFSPANVMPLVEVVQGAATTPNVLASVVALGRAMRKVAVVARVGPGFIGNRMIDQYVRQALVLVSEGIAPDRIDHALQSWGMAMGPFAMLDLVGNDVPAMSRREAGVVGPEWAVADAIVERGWYGRKTGAGWYVYDEKVPRPNTGLADLLPQPTTDTVTDADIVERCIYALVNEGARVLSDGVALKGSDIDMVYLNGYGFPADRGGPLFFAETVGLDRVVRSMSRFAAETGDAFWEPDPALEAAATASASLTAGAVR